MIRATYKDKELIVGILTSSFFDNKSVNYIVKQDQRKAGRIRQLMTYSFEVCYLFGDVFLSDDKKGCALIIMPDRKKTTFKSIGLDLRLVWNVIGLSGMMKAISRESRINRLHPPTPIYYLWFVGVDPLAQHRGIGTKLVKEIMNEGLSKGRSVYLETSTAKNVPWYEKFGLKVYEKLDFGYELYCMKKEC